jgi:hypothetical protein
MFKTNKTTVAIALILMATFVNAITTLPTNIGRTA